MTGLSIPSLIPERRRNHQLLITHVRDTRSSKDAWDVTNLLVVEVAEPFHSTPLMRLIFTEHSFVLSNRRSLISCVITSKPDFVLIEKLIYKCAAVSDLKVWRPRDRLFRARVFLHAVVLQLMYADVWWGKSL